MRFRFPLLCITVVTLSVGCGEESFPPPPAPVLSNDTEMEPETDVTTSAESDEVRLPGERRPFDGLKFAVPAGWEEIPLSDMQKGIVTAKFSMPNAGPDVTLTLSRSGGGLEANMDRWRGQVSSSRPEIVDSISVAGVDSTLIDLEGRFSGGFGQGPKDNWRMLGVIVPLPDQGYFLKLTGPVEEVSAVEEEFRSFARSGAKE